MANEGQLEILKQGTQAWHAWRARNPRLAPDLSGANLSYLELVGVEFAQAILSNAVLTGANLTGADFGRADLSKAQFAGASLAQTDLTLARLEGADLSGALGLAQPQLDRACGDTATQLPKGLVRPTGWPCRTQE